MYIDIFKYVRVPCINICYKKAVYFMFFMFTVRIKKSLLRNKGYVYLCLINNI